MCAKLMASKRCLLMVILFLCLVFSFSAKAIARNLSASSQLYAAGSDDENGVSRRLLGQEQTEWRPPCKRRRATYESHDYPRGHNYVIGSNIICYHCKKKNSST